MNSKEAIIQTVLGPVDARLSGICLVHEHPLIDMRSAYPEENPGEARPLSIDTLGEARRDFTRFPDAIVLDDSDQISGELQKFADQGGRTVVDTTPAGLRLPGPGRHARELQGIARKTGLNIVTGCGHYVRTSHPEAVAGASVEELADTMIAEITEGIDGTDVKAGMIGEIGLGQPPHPDEWKVLEAACLAQRATGVGMQIHPYFGENSRIAPAITRFVLQKGVDPSRVAICHMDGHMNIEYQRRVADMGVFIQFDTFGLEIYYDNMDYNHNCHDSQREMFLVRLLDLGYADQIMISHDVATKLQLVAFGGYGFGHILRNIVPSLRFRGLDDAVLRQLLELNPRRFLQRAASAGTA